MTKHIKIDFISDVSCPWCAIGLAGLERALRNAADTVDAEIVFQPYELNPGMPAGGQNIVEHVAQKYGSTAKESDANRAILVRRAADEEFDMAVTADSRIYNTFDAHRLLHWAGLEGRQLQLKHALFAANFTQNQDIGRRDVLEGAVVAAGLDLGEARAILESDTYAQEVRHEIAAWRAKGIASVPTIILNDTYLVSGGLPSSDFEEIVRRVAAEM